VRLSVTRVLVVACLFLTLSACGGKPDVAAASGSSKQADEAAIRALLGNIQSTFNAGNLDEFMPVFADDAVISSQGSPDVVGAPAIRAMYEAALNQMGIQVSFDTQELEVFGDLACEARLF
jgi:ketosteroid isomerase-like protein